MTNESFTLSASAAVFAMLWHVLIALSYFTMGSLVEIPKPVTSISWDVMGSRKFVTALKLSSKQQIILICIHHFWSKILELPPGKHHGFCFIKSSPSPSQGKLGMKSCPFPMTIIPPKWVTNDNQQRMAFFNPEYYSHGIVTEYYSYVVCNQSRDS